MKKIDIYNLIYKVENELLIPLSANSDHECENWIFDKTGVLPVYITNVYPEYVNKKGTRYIVIHAMQPSGNMVSFRMPYDTSKDNHVLPTNRTYALTVGRYAELKVKENDNSTEKKSRKSSEKNRFFVEEINVISDEKIIKILNELDDEYVAEGGVA